jgi:hypothetical protein
MRNYQLFKDSVSWSSLVKLSRIILCDFIVLLLYVMHFFQCINEDHTNIMQLYEIRGSHGDEDVDYGFLECDIV